MHKRSSTSSQKTTEWLNHCDCCGILIKNRYIDLYIPRLDIRTYNHDFLLNGIWVREDIIFLCIDCMLYRKNYVNNPWWSITIPKCIPEEQIDRYAKRLLFGKNRGGLKNESTSNDALV